MNDTADGIYSNGHESSRFCLRKVNGRIREWRRNGERHLEPIVQPTVAYNGGSVMIWAGITLNGRSALVVVLGNLNGRCYIDEILRPHVVPRLCQMDQNVIFQDDNARPHRARIVLFDLILCVPSTTFQFNWDGSSWVEPVLS